MGRQSYSLMAEEEEEGPLQGHQEIEHEDGSKYSGEFVDGKRHGHGVFLFANSVGTYEGQFSEGQAHGTGVFTWPSGGRIEGQWTKGKHTGQALFSWSDGTA